MRRTTSNDNDQYCLYIEDTPEGTKVVGGCGHEFVCTDEVHSCPTCGADIVFASWMEW